MSGTNKGRPEGARRGTVKPGPWSMRNNPRDTWLNRLFRHPVAMGYIRYPPIWHLVLVVPFGAISMRVFDHLWERPSSITEPAVYVGLVIFALPFVGTLAGLTYALAFNLLHRRRIRRLEKGLHGPGG